MKPFFGLVKKIEPENLEDTNLEDTNLEDICFFKDHVFVVDEQPFFLQALGCFL